MHPAKVAAIHGWLRDALLGSPGVRRMRRILCIRGPTGSGKSVLLQALQREGDFRLSPDAKVFGSVRTKSNTSTGSSRSHNPATTMTPVLSDPNWGFEVVRFDAHSLPSLRAGGRSWDGGEPAQLATAFGTFLYEAVTGRFLPLMRPPPEEEEQSEKPNKRSLTDHRQLSICRSPPPPPPARAMSLSPTATRPIRLSQLSTLLEEPDQATSSLSTSAGTQRMVLGSRTPFRRTQSTPQGLTTSSQPSQPRTSETTLIAPPPLPPPPIPRKTHKVILVDDLPNL